MSVLTDASVSELLDGLVDLISAAEWDGRDSASDLRLHGQMVATLEELVTVWRKSLVPRQEPTRLSMER